MRVLVAGAGVAGLSTAIALRARGHEVDVVERTAEGTIAGAGIYLPGNATRAFADLGVVGRFADRAAVIGAQRFSDHRGRLIAQVDTAKFWDGVGPCLAVHRSDLHTALTGAAGPVGYDTAVETISQDGAGVAVTLSSGTRDTYDLVVGADGRRSTVRGLLGLPGARPVGQRSWRFVVPAGDAVRCWAVQLGRGAAFLAMPIGAGLVYCYADVAADVTGDLDELFAGFGEPAAGLLAARGDTRPYESVLDEVALRRWYDGRVVIIGDAAHATSPNMAQGAALAAEDALVLAEVLPAAGARPTAAAVTAALAAFQARRKPRTDRVLRQSHRRDRTRTLAPALRNMIIRRAETMYRVNYGPLLRRP